MSENNAAPSIADELLKLKSLLDAGVLTQAEFERQKADVLGGSAMSAQPVPQPISQSMPQPLPISQPMPPPMYAPAPQQTYAPQPVYAPAPPPQKAKKTLLPVLLGCVGVVVLAVVLAGGYFLNERMGWLDIGSWGEKTVEDYAVTLTFQYEGESYERKGTYDGVIKHKLPNGQGVFSASRSDGVKYTLEGTWTDGMINGPGKQLYANGESYIGEHLNNDWHGHGVWTQKLDGNTFTYEGEFEATAPADEAEYLAAYFANACMEGYESSYGDLWRQTVRENPEFFPAQTRDDIDALSKLVKTGVTYAQMDKNTLKYAGEFFQYQGSIIQVEENYGTTFLIVMDDDWNIYYLMYLAEVGFLKGDTVRFVATPVCTYSYENMSGGTTNSIAMLACRLY